MMSSCVDYFFGVYGEIHVILLTLDSMHRVKMHVARCTTLTLGVCKVC